ncbi:MAG: hypothetical protein ACRENO_04650 [Thermodesulfobacteriota bacterium]
MKRIKAILNRIWFTDAPPERLAVLRVLIGVYTLHYVSTSYKELIQISASSQNHFDPVGFASLLEQPISPLLFKSILLLTLIFNVLFVIGFKFRYSGPIFSVLHLFLLSYRNSWSMIYHSQNVLVFHALILGFTRAADVLSIDYLLKSGFLAGLKGKSDKVKKPVVESAGWRYGWPIMLMCAVSVCTYFLAGIAKVEGEVGWGWISGEALRSQVAVDGLRKEILGSEATNMFFTLYDNLFLFTIMGAGTFILELGAPIALYNRRLGQIWAISAFFMHWGIYFIMGIKFRYQLSGIFFTTFFDMEKVVNWIKPNKNSKAEND